MKKTIRILMTLQLIAAWVLCFIVGCTDNTNNESQSVPLMQAMRLTGERSIIVVDKNNDTLIITSKDTSICVAYQIVDTVWLRRGATAPQDDQAGPKLTGYGTVVEYNAFVKLDPNQLGKGRLVPNPTKANDTVFNAEVRKGDPQISSGFRSEQNFKTTPLEGGCEFDVMFLSKYDGSLFWQVHGNTSGTSGVTSGWCSGGYMFMYSDERRNNTYQQSGIEQIALNIWDHFRIEWKFASRENGGYLKVYKNGRKYYEAVNVKMNDVLGQYGKIGINIFGAIPGTSPGSMSVLYNNLLVFRK